MEIWQGVLLIVVIVGVMLFMASRGRGPQNFQLAPLAPERDPDPTRYHILTQIPGAMDTFIDAMYETFCDKKEYPMIHEIDHRHWNEVLNGMGIVTFSHLLIKLNSVSENTKCHASVLYTNYVRSKYPLGGKAHDDFFKFLGGAPKPPVPIDMIELLMASWMFKALFQRPRDDDDDEHERFVEQVRAILYRVMAEKMGLQFVGEA